MIEDIIINLSKGRKIIYQYDHEAQKYVEIVQSRFSKEFQRPKSVTVEEIGNMILVELYKVENKLQDKKEREKLLEEKN